MLVRSSCKCGKREREREREKERDRETYIVTAGAESWVRFRTSWNERSDAQLGLDRLDVCLRVDFSILVMGDARLVMLWDMIEEHQSSLIHHSSSNKPSPVQSNIPLNP